MSHQFAPTPLSFVEAVLWFLVGIIGLQFYTVRDAIVAGFGWESFVNKVITSQQTKDRNSN